jgi:hypothetical protein
MQTSSNAHQETSSGSHGPNGNGQAGRSAQPYEQPEANVGDATLRAVRMLRMLCREVVRSETAVRLRCGRGATRLEQLPPAAKLRACAEHAQRALESLPGQGTRRRLPMKVAGTLTATVRARIQGAVGDRLISSERAYRHTLLGLRKSVDLVRMLRELARLQSEPALEAWCSEWLDARMPLVLEVEDGLAWFAHHSDQATRLARPLELHRRG